MLFRRILFALCACCFLWAGSVTDPNVHSQSASPLWVKHYEVPLEPIPVKPSQVNLQHLLIDIQRNWEEKTLYRHFAIKILTQTGVKSISQIKVDFDPSYNQVVMHGIRVFRDGEWVDRLESARYNLIQRETELEQNIYNGDLTLVYFVGDIRTGDILEYSYSLVGYRPLFSSHYTDKLYLQRDFSVEQIAYRLLGHPNLSFLTKNVNVGVEPKICDLSPSLREWSWEVVETSPYSWESGQPFWHNPLAQVEMSEYRSWEEVVKKLHPLYVLPADLNQSVPSEMRALVEEWKSMTGSASERALLALRFVQDQIRYLGIEEGMGAFQPTDPRVTFQRRFGDCKDKSFLLHAFLQLMGISSKSLLVHTERGKKLSDILPTPFAFDHLVLQVEIEGATYYVDPTFTLQGGSLKTSFFPDYGWGLLLSEGSKELISLPKINFKNPTEIDLCFTLVSEDLAHLKIKNVFHASRADRLRRIIERNGFKEMEEDWLAVMQEVYGGAALNAPLEISDDRNNNILTMVESYRVPTQEVMDKKEIDVFSHTLRNYLQTGINPERDSPYEICYPLWVKETIQIDNPFGDWKHFEKDYKKEHKSFVYTLSTRIKKKQANFQFELKHLQDHIPQDALREYWQLVNDIKRTAPSKMAIASLPTISEPMVPWHLYSILGFIIWPILYLTSKRKRLTQDSLSFQIDKFRKFYSLTIVLTSLFIIENPLITLPIVLVLNIFVSVLCTHLVFQRPSRTYFGLKNFLCFHGWMLCFIFEKSDIQLHERVLAIGVCYLYLVPSFLALREAESLLVEEEDLIVV